jgi:hypothetical protein
MKLTTILMLGAAALTAPAFAAETGASSSTQGMAQSANGSTATQSQTAANTTTPVAGASATTSNQAAMNGSSSQPATNADTSSNTSANGQMAANTSTSASTSGGADISALSSVPDTQKKYKRSARASDFQKEAETTRQLNQQVASAGGLPKVQ